MNDALVRDGGTVTVARRPFAGPAPDAVRVLRAGICGTDLDIFRGVRRDTAAVLGHEGIGEIGGRRVIFNPVSPADQDVILGHSYDGIFQEVVDGRRTHLVPARDDLPVGLGPLVEPLAVALYARRLLCAGGVPPTVGIWGGGTAAVLSAIVARRAGSAVHLVHPRPERLAWLRDRGVLDGVATGAAPTVAAAMLCTAQRGAPAALSEAVRHLRAGGVVDLYGGFGGGDHHDDLPGTDLASVRRANACGRPEGGASRAARTRSGRPLIVTGHRGCPDADLLTAQEMLAAEPGLFGRLISHVVPLREAARLIPALAAGRGGEFLKVVVDLEAR